MDTSRSRWVKFGQYTVGVTLQVGLCGEMKTHVTHPSLSRAGRPGSQRRPVNLGAETPGQNVTLEAI